MIKAIIFAVKANRDQTEGKGPMYTVARFSNKEEAIQLQISKDFARDYGVQGTPYAASDVEEEEIKVYDSFAEYSLEKREDIRKRALAKLTQEEKRVLGLSD